MKPWRAQVEQLHSSRPASVASTSSRMAPQWQERVWGMFGLAQDKLGAAWRQPAPHFKAPRGRSPAVVLAAGLMTASPGVPGVENVCVAAASALASGLGSGE